MSTTIVIGLVAVTLLLVAWVVFAQAISFFLMAIAFSGLLYRYAEERYPEAVGIAGSTTGITEPQGQATRENPLGDIDNDFDEDIEAVTGISDDEWLLGNQ